MSTELRSGENTKLVGRSVKLEVNSQGVQVDVSAVLLTENRKVRTDSDLVFFNNPSHDGVSLDNNSISIDMGSIPPSIALVAIVVSLDPAGGQRSFTSAPRIAVRQAGAIVATFSPDAFTSGETVLILAEIYRRGTEWKARAIGQGYASGLAGLATDFGVTVDDDGTSAAPEVSAVTPTSAAINLRKVEQQAPALIPAAREAAEALSRAGVNNCRAAVYLVLDHSFSSRELYDSFAMQAFAERILALAVSLDDDGTVPVVFTAQDPFLEEIRLDNYRGRIGQLHTQVDWGWDDTLVSMRCVVDHYQRSGTETPAFAIVHVEHEPGRKAEIRTLLQNTATLGIFWLFVGFGGARSSRGGSRVRIGRTEENNLTFYENLDASVSATFPNTAFYDVGQNPGSLPGDEFFTDLVASFGPWISRAN